MIIAAPAVPFSRVGRSSILIHYNVKCDSIYTKDHNCIRRTQLITLLLAYFFKKIHQTQILGRLLDNLIVFVKNFGRLVFVYIGNELLNGRKRFKPICYQYFARTIWFAGWIQRTRGFCISIHYGGDDGRSSY